MTDNSKAMKFVLIVFVIAVFYICFLKPPAGGGSKSSNSVNINISVLGDINNAVSQDDGPRRSPTPMPSGTSFSEAIKNLF